jgi:hypothetical protein
VIARRFGVITYGQLELAITQVDGALTTSGSPGTASLAGNGNLAVLGAVIISAAVFGVTGAGLGALLGSEFVTGAGLLLYLYVAEPLISHISALHTWTAYLLGAAADGLTQASQAGVRLLAPWQGGRCLPGRRG